MEQYYKVYYNYENVPTVLKPVIRMLYIKYRSEAVKAVNGMYSELNSEWDKTGKDAGFGPYLEDINPEYEQFINSHVQPIIDRRVNKNRIFRIVSGRYCDLEMTVKGIKGSRVWIDLVAI